MAPSVVRHPRTSMTPTLLSTGGGVEAILFRRNDAARSACQAEILASGGSLPAYHRVEASRLDPGTEQWFIGLRPAGGAFAAGFAVDLRQPRLAFGHAVARASHFGAWIPERFRATAIDAITTLARTTPRILRTNVGIFGTDANEVARLSESCAAAGLAPAPEPWGYQHTLMIDLARSEEDILASFSRSGRRNIREIVKYGIQVEPITESRFCARIDAMLGETMARTGGHYVPQDWERRLELARTTPSVARLAGAYLGDDREPDSLLAFALGYAHGPIAEYSDAASIRLTGSRAPLAYALIWDLVRWARAAGASRFDLGGVTFGTHTDGADPLGGISDFKRSFTEDVRRVGAEMIFNAPTLRGTVARWILARRRTAPTASQPAGTP